ncbi:MAG: Xaa-Pro aminopeptidase [Candidatus Acidoferrum typicum]|nr:Xaa-Pro aminopeptidase [Candidatus Acidoferrum typicum]
MRTNLCVLILLLSSAANVFAADIKEMHDRRQRAAAAFPDGILFVHAHSSLDITADGFRQNPIFYYFTGLENTVGAVFAIEGKSGECWLFLPTHPPFVKSGLQPEVVPGVDAAKRLGVEHVVDWFELEGFLAQRADSPLRIYYADDPSAFDELPPNMLGQKADGAPLWVQVIRQKWPSLEVKEVGPRVNALMAVQSLEEVSSLRSAGKVTVSAWTARMRAIRPGVSQRSVEAAVETACWNAGAHGSSFWPWAMAGENAVFPRPFTSLARYDHLNVTMRPGDLVRLDVGCEWSHYVGDLGRTVPVSGHYSDDQRETWNIFVAAYHAGVGVLRDGVTVDQVFDAWRAELLRHRATAKTRLAQHAIDSWSKRENVPFWQVHLTNLVVAFPTEPLRARTTINFEPIAAIDGQGFFLEDMYLITKDGAELLTVGVPYSVEEIEAAMR